MFATIGQVTKPTSMMKMAALNSRRYLPTDTRHPLSISTTINYWSDMLLMEVREFLFNREEWQRERSGSWIWSWKWFGKDYRTDMNELIEEMYRRVRYFESIGIQFEPPDEMEFEEFRGTMQGRSAALQNILRQDIDDYISTGMR